MDPLKKGYKQTSLGLIPNEWEINKLIDLCIKSKRAIVDGPFGSNLKTIHFRESGIPVINSSFVTDFNFAPDKYTYVDEDLFKREIRSKVEPGDIIMAKIGARCGSSAIMPNNHPISILSGNTLKISINNELNSTLFVWYWLVQVYMSNQFSEFKSTGAQPAISTPVLKSLLVPTPPLTEQIQIAKLLAAWDKSIETTRQLIKQKGIQKKALMQELLSGKKRLKGYSEKWHKVKLGEVCEIDKLSLTSQTPADYSFHYLSLSDVDSGKAEFNSERIFFRDAPSRARRVVRKGDVLLSTVRPNLQGFLIIRHNIKDLIASTGFAVITCTKIYNEYLYQFLFTHSVMKQIKSFLVGSNYPAINSSDVKKIIIPFPTFEEQIAIATVLQLAEKEIHLFSQKLELLKEQKKGLMQNILTGQLRVKV